ncbi:MAG: TIGR03435 family protein [Acidobacteria bacterium]|nr:TIGR03435 family protein [Acidobacteriota bacterium]
MASLRCIAVSLAAAAAALAQGARPEFEVASIRAAEPYTQGQVTVGIHIDGAQVNIRDYPLKDYIRVAYRLKDYQVSGPEWLAAAHFDVSAKIPDGTARDKVPDMLAALLEERFKLKTHMESRDFPVYALIPGKGGVKLKESAPLEGAPAAAAAAPNVNVTASGSARGVNIDLGHGSYFAFADNKLEARRLDVQRFADTLSRFTDRPVVDMTGLTGQYDITLNFTPEDYLAMLIRSALNAGVALPPQALRALEMSSGDSLASALQTVGLKLDARKAPLPLLVIDHIEKTPSAN